MAKETTTIRIYKSDNMALDFLKEKKEISKQDLIKEAVADLMAKESTNKKD